jgi:hypothetical protein
MNISPSESPLETSAAKNHVVPSVTTALIVAPGARLIIESDCAAVRFNTLGLDHTAKSGLPCTRALIRSSPLHQIWWKSDLDMHRGLPYTPLTAEVVGNDTLLCEYNAETCRWIPTEEGNEEGALVFVEAARTAFRCERRGQWVVKDPISLQDAVLQVDRWQCRASVPMDPKSKAAVVLREAVELCRAVGMDSLEVARAVLRQQEQCHLDERKGLVGDPDEEAIDVLIAVFGYLGATTKTDSTVDLRLHHKLEALYGRIEEYRNGRP